MSVLKYNNNGTWEGLNIDHASTADSALYDADGNVISSTYLPLSAGSSKPLTGSLWLNNSESSSPVQAKIKAEDNGAYFEGYYNGALDGGLSTVRGDGRAIVYGNGNAVMFRPNGRTNANGQVYVDANGQIVGGATYDEKVNKTESNLSQSWNTLHTYTLSAGVYILTGQLTIQPGGAGYFSLHIAENGSTSNYHFARQAMYSPQQGGSFGINVCGLAKISSSTTFTLYAWINGNGTHKHEGSRLAYIRIA